jgi:hypothetical protein
MTEAAGGEQRQDRGAASGQQPQQAGWRMLRGISFSSSFSCSIGLREFGEEHQNDNEKELVFLLFKPAPNLPVAIMTG